MSYRSKAVETWDDVIASFLRNGAGYKLKEPLGRWFEAYSGAGQGQVVREAFPEPYIGDLAAGRPRAVMLGLNPGRVDLNLQGREGSFAREIRALGSYHRWAATLPYFGETWRQAHGKNRFHEARLRFLRDWFGPCFDCREVLTFELYPWHSTQVNALIHPDPDVINRFIWKPIAEMGNPITFAFGAPWMTFVQGGNMGFSIKARLGDGGQKYGSRVLSRSVLLACSPKGGIVIVEKHRGGAGPPRTDETELLRDYLAQHPALLDCS